MNRALELAALGIGNVSPNPLVGCVIVHNNEIIGEGFHQKYGEKHAEVNAIESVRDPSLLEKSTLYVTLEPCSHHGKTPPCSDLIIKKKIKKVVVAIKDPNPLVSGSGIRKLRDAGVQVELDLGRDKAIEVNKRFLTSVVNKRPYVILKWAQTADGFLARKNHDSKWISDEYSRAIVHTWRAQEDAIMVGKNTAKYDNPKLTVRGTAGKNPLRVVLDQKLELDRKLELFSDGLPTLCYNLNDSKVLNETEFIKVTGKSFIEGVLADLGSRNIQSLIVEGGAQLLSSFIDKDLWDEARVFTSPKFFGDGIKAP
ncbi:MAG: bifunctional diaminohydroxyphosphoribosylaminopyrimidine deaminase/5-amino-6-(5-phosphoribosylamino)uracil reductase RibD, partial [Bacteroidota bacterium]